MKKVTKKTRKTRSRAWILAATVASAAILAVIVGTVVSSKAQQANIEPQAQTQDDQDVTVEFANEKIKIDAKTGKLRKPTVEEARALVETITGLTDRSGHGLKVERGPDGRKQVDLKDRFQSVVLAKPNPDGTNEVRCVTSIEEAAAFLGINPSKLPAKNKSPKTN